ncbi:MAG: ATP-binding protein [Candidatus Micrarchaeota archaeon]|nr:ATP-binding protein [Candidatus Micrarchaeota archaeon]
MFYEVKKWYPSLKSREKSLPKIYLADHGFLENGGKAFENVVFLELLRHGKKVYYIVNGSYEVDFYIPPATYIQATWNLEEAQSRELRALEKVKGRKCIIVPYFTDEAVPFFDLDKCFKTLAPKK